MFCNHFCNMSYYTGFVYGKYKGEMVIDVVKKDFSYIEELNNCEPRLWEKYFGLCLHNEFDWNFIKIIKTAKHKTISWQAHLLSYKDFI